MRTLLIAHALLLMTDPDTAGGIPAESNPNTNDAGAAPAPEIATGGSDQAGNGAAGQDLTELDADFARRIEAERAEFEKIRAETPVQELELRPCPGAAKLGVIIGNPEGVRCIPLADWRTDRLVLRAGDNAHIVVLAGEGLKTWDFYCEQERRQKEEPPEPAVGTVQTASIPPEMAGKILGAAVASEIAKVPAVDPLEDTQPVTPLRDPDAVLAQS